MYIVIFSISMPLLNKKINYEKKNLFDISEICKIFWFYLKKKNLMVYLIYWYFSRIWRAEVEVNNGETLFVPADCIKGRIQWNLPNPSTELDVQFQSQNPSNCFVSNYPERFANYEVIEDGVPTKPYRGNLFYV